MFYDLAWIDRGVEVAGEGTGAKATCFRGLAGRGVRPAVAVQAVKLRQSAAYARCVFLPGFRGRRRGRQLAR